MDNLAPSSPEGAATSSRVSSASAILLLRRLPDSAGLLLFCSRNLADGHAKTLLRRSRGSKSRKESEGDGEKTGFCLFRSDGCFVVGNEAGKNRREVAAVF